MRLRAPLAEGCPTGEPTVAVCALTHTHIAYINTAAAYVRAGQVELAINDSTKGVEIMRALVASAAPKAFQRIIFAAILAVHGTILTAAGKTDAAITDLESARSIYESFYEAGSMDNHANVAACDVKLGEAAAKADRDQQAQSYFHQALTLAEPLTTTEPPDLDALYAAADAYSGLGSLSVRKAQRPGETKEHRRITWTEARSLYEQSVKTWQRIDHPNHTAPNFFLAGDPVSAKKQLELAEKAVASLR